MIFIVGNSRSGTMMLGRVLGKHCTVHTFEEMHFFENLVSAKEMQECPEWEEVQCIELLRRLRTTAHANIFESVKMGAYLDTANAILGTTKHRDPVSVYRAFLNCDLPPGSPLVLM